MRAMKGQEIVDRTLNHVSEKFWILNDGEVCMVITLISGLNQFKM